MSQSLAGVVLGLGSACIDTFLEVERVPAAGGKVMLRRELDLPGGQVASTLVGCVRLGVGARFLLRTGADAAGARIRSTLAAAGVDLGPARVLPGVASASAYILHDASGERTVIWRAPERLAVTAEEIAPELLAGVAAVFCDGRDGAATLRLARMARERGIPVVGDLDYWYPHTGELLRWVDHLVVPASFDLPADTGAATVVVTRGAAGSVGWEAGGARVEVPAYPAAMVDTTGAGDAYHAGYLVGLVEGWDLAQRMRFASATAALACGGLGAQGALPTRAEVEALLRRHPA